MKLSTSIMGFLLVMLYFGSYVFSATDTASGSINASGQMTDPKQLQDILGVYDHWYVSLAVGMSLDSTFEYTVKAVSNNQSEHLYKMHSLGTPSIYIMPFSLLLVYMTSPDCITDLKVADSDSLDPSKWGVEAKSIKIVSFKTGLYVLPGAKVPYELLNPIYAGIRTNEMVPFYESPSIINLFNAVGQDDEMTNVILYYAMLDSGASLLIREAANLYDAKSDRLYPLHCFDFVYSNATSYRDVPKKAFLKIFADRRPLLAPFFRPPPMGNDAFRSPGGIGVNYEYYFDCLKVESPEYYGDIPYVKSVTVIEDPIPNCYGPNSIFPLTTEEDRIISVSIENVVEQDAPKEMTRDDITALHMLRKMY